MHYAIQKLHWSPLVVNEWFDAEQSVRALYYASTELKLKRDKEEADKIKRSSKRKRR